ncbi:hypothetical protein [Legionella parisiensis]|uniref:Uncharacterized protein n=1 Tax=Legionella parisiensis TaxID=45071 RepID=A0A1E5JUU0_9GAMM|nr:hypothetical protein [Legionella parisiensis]OEH48255.1 hypothetical protein lpari_00747 [Legionella parisiensis]STX77773.1 Uncharacterised protein [Legionella parisiensis]
MANSIGEKMESLGINHPEVLGAHSWSSPATVEVDASFEIEE